MHKIIFDTFEFDLSSYDISIVEDNYWFSDQFFTKYSFPFNFKLTEDLIKEFGELLDDNAKFIDTSFDVKYVFGNQLETAVFEIESQVGKEITSTFRFGFDELPNYDKKLSELPLEETTITDVFAHAKTIIPQKWPYVNYNYPQIHTDKYDTTIGTWETFLKKLNNYDGTDFLENSNASEDFYNKNIIQPLPYLLHIITQGFLDAGFTVTGDFITNEAIKKILIYTDLDYFNRVNNSVNEKIYRTETTTTSPFEDDPLLYTGQVFYYKAIELEPNSTYRISGEGNCYSTATKSALVGLVYKGSVLSEASYLNEDPTTWYFDVDFNSDSDTSPTTQVLEIYGYGTDINIQPEEVIFDINIQRVLENSPDEIHIKEEVNLKNVVPDKTFGAFISEWKNFLNLSVEPIGNVVHINFIEDSLNYNNALDLTDYCVLKPEKEFNKLKAFHLKFNDIDIVNGFYNSVLQDKETITQNPILIPEDTEEIPVNCIPLFQKSNFLIETACAFESGGSKKTYFVLYDGLQGGLNTTVDITDFSLPLIHNRYHQKWYEFRLFSTNYKWRFKMYQEDLSKLDKKVFAYGRYHIVKTLEKTQIAEGLFEVEIETETLP